MADTERRFSELSVAATLTDNDILALSQTDIGTSTLISVRATLIAIATHIAKVAAFTNDLDTTNKTLIGAINELKQLISLIPQFSIEVVQTLPVSDISETTIYLVPNSNPEQGNYYDEYIYVNNTWELVGTTAVDLSAYYTKLEVDTLLAAKANTSDVTAALALKEAKSDLDDDVTDIIVALTDTQTATGNPVTFTTVQEGGAKSALVTFAPKQSGTGDPSPSNIRPISGWDGLNLTRTGKNLLDSSEIEQGSINSSGADASSSSRIRSGYAEVKPNTQYTVSVASGFLVVNFHGYIAKDGVSVQSPSAFNERTATFTTGETVKYVRFVFRNESGTAITPSDISGVQLEKGDTSTTYEPYQGLTTHTATFPSTITGGSYDFESGKGVKNYSIVTYNGSENWMLTDNPHVFYLSLYSTFQNEIIPICNKYKGFGNGTSGSMNNNEIRRNQNGNNLLIRDDRASTVEEFKALCADENITVAYFRNTAVEITLTPADVNLLKGLNTVWTDGDTVQVKYSELPQGNLGAVIDYIQKLEARIAALES